MASSVKQLKKNVKTMNFAFKSFVVTNSCRNFCLYFYLTFRKKIEILDLIIFFKRCTIVAAAIIARYFAFRYRIIVCSTILQGN